MRLWLITVLACIVAVNANSLKLGVGGGFGSGGYGYGGREGGSSGYSQSGYDHGRRDSGHNYGYNSHDYKALVEGHDTREHIGSYDQAYNNRGMQSGGYETSGRSGYAGGYHMG